MRVLYLNPFSQLVSGPDESLLAVLPALRARGVEAVVALPTPGPQVMRYTAAGAAVAFLPLSILRRNAGVLGAASWPGRLLLGAGATMRLMRREHIDLVHTNMEVVLDGALAASVLRVPHVLHYRGNTNGSPKLVFDLLTRLWARSADAVVCISRGTSHLFNSRGLDASVIYDSIDLDVHGRAVRDDSVRAQLGAARPTDVLFAAVARLHPRKGLDLFVRACAITAAAVPHSRFVLVGDATVDVEHDYERHLRHLTARLGMAERIVFAGARRDMAAVFAALDVLVLPSRHEGFGRVIAEAMAASRPVVASNEGAPIEVVRHRVDGFLADPTSERAFAERMIELGQDPDLRLQMGKSARERSAAFSIEAGADALYEIYRTVLSKRRGC